MGDKYTCAEISEEEKLKQSLLFSFSRNCTVRLRKIENRISQGNFVKSLLSGEIQGQIVTKIQLGRVA